MAGKPRVCMDRDFVGGCRGVASGERPVDSVDSCPWLVPEAVRVILQSVQVLSFQSPLGSEGRQTESATLREHAESPQKDPPAA